MDRNGRSPYSQNHRATSSQTLTGPDVAGLEAHEPLEWSAVVVFHPDTRRIGARALLPVEGSALVVGRGMPRFQGLRQSFSAEPLADPHVSRNAFIVQREKRHWTIQRGSERARIRLDGKELEGVHSLSDHQLAEGISLTLGNRVVLHLRQQRPSEPEPELELQPAALRALLGVSKAMATLRRRIRDIAVLEDDVLLIGPTGSGKELAARAIHACAPRGACPWVAVNMAALPEELAPASLFGVKRGAYTGAQNHREGYFQQARNGLLFLDEVGDTPQSLQPQLLRALQEREVQVVGGPVERVELRVVAATEHDPDAPGSALRSALRYRLGTQELRLPALADRREDLGLLSAAVFREYARRDGLPWAAEEPNEMEIPRWVRLFELFLAYPWPGNVRELRAVIAQLYACDGQGLTVPAELLQRLRGDNVCAADDPDPEPQAQSAGQVREHSAVDCSGEAEAGAQVSQLSDEAFESAWRDANFEVTRMARELGVSRAAIYRRLKSLRSCRLAHEVPLAELLAALDKSCGDLEVTARDLGVSERGLAARLRSGGARVGGDGESPG